ncbi:SWIM zinc finger family protein [Streptosporangium sp. LJ11]|uniref:SWIM zinc finger family protein n=1 Tax=Streptosporangium sp. LJ11 TaxID=3436927 RepID=UPI003F7A9E80
MTNAVQAYAYAGPSTLTAGRLALSTSGGRTVRGPLSRPRFFSGLLTEAAPAAAGLLAVANVAQARYDRPVPTFSRDPVVTCNGDRLRFESFSACGGVYARLDVLERALDGEVVDLGTTNVDVNGPLREALARVGADLVGALLAFEPRVEPDLLAERSGLDASRVRAALTQLGAAGRVGYDTAEAGYFHRELPYDRDRVAAMNPRARAARELAGGGAVRLDGPGRALVTSGDQVREVRGTACTCPWWARHQGRRGPCKHVLAVQIMRGART